MYDVPLEGPDHKFWETRPSKAYRLFMIGMHCVNVSIIYLLWGWAPALLFAVHPIGVWGTAWVTGNYYATTAYFTLIAYYILHTFPNIWGALVAIPIYMSALNSTICAINFPFIFLFMGTPWGLTMFLPLIGFLTGKKFQTGIKIRLSFHENKNIVDTRPTWRRGLLMTKVMGRYIYTALVPDKLGFFGPFGTDLRDSQKKYDAMHSANKEFWYSLALCLTLAGVGLIIQPQGTIWFFVLMSLHTQWNLTGQFYAQRYLYLPLVGICVIVGTALQAYPVLMAIITTYLVIRTWLFIPVWRHQEFVWKNDMETYPGFGKTYSNLAQFYMVELSKKRQDVIQYVGYLITRAIIMMPTSWEVHMNYACFLANTGHIDGALHHTREAIKFLEPLGGLPGPLIKLKEQEKKIIEAIEKKKKQQGELGHSFTPKQQGGRGNGKSKKEEEGSTESNGNREPARREEVAGARS